MPHRPILQQIVPSGVSEWRKRVSLDSHNSPHDGHSSVGHIEDGFPSVVFSKSARCTGRRLAWMQVSRWISVSLGGRRSTWIGSAQSSGTGSKATACIARCPEVSLIQREDPIGRLWFGKHHDRSVGNPDVVVSIPVPHRSKRRQSIVTQRR